MARQRIDYGTELGQVRCQSIVDSKRVAAEINSTECWLFSGSRNTDGYGQVYAKKNSNLHLEGRQSQTAFLIHRVAFVAANGRDITGHGSHLCDNRNCFNPAHIVDETPDVNNSRKGCAGLLVCGWHHHILCDLCPHRPRCIRPERFDISCCLALKESDPVSWASQTSRNDPSSQYSDPTSSLPHLNMPSPVLPAESSRPSDSFGSFPSSLPLPPSGQQQ